MVFRVACGVRWPERGRQSISAAGGLDESGVDVGSRSTIRAQAFVSHALLIRRRILRTNIAKGMALIQLYGERGWTTHARVARTGNAVSSAAASIRAKGGGDR